MVEFKSVFAGELIKFIDHKRSLGYQYKASELALRGLDRFFLAKSSGKVEVTKKMCDEWCVKRESENAGGHFGRVSLLRVFCRYLKEEGYDVVIPAKGVPRLPPKYNAHIYTDEELRRFFAAVDSTVPWINSPYRHIVMPVFFRILYTSGMRVSELRLATLKDVDLDCAMIKVRNGKNGKDRLVPVHPALVERCLQLKDKLHGQSTADDFFFPVSQGKEWTANGIYCLFRRYLIKAGIEHTGHGPRVHDFRHTYCVNLLRKWVAEKKDLLSWMPYMTAALGHETFRETAYYLKLTVGSFPQMRDQLSQAIPSVIEDIEDENNEYY